MAVLEAMIGRDLGAVDGGAACDGSLDGNFTE
jgi:hypothetical protein